MSPTWRILAPFWILLVLHLLTLFGGFLAPNSAVRQDRDSPWAPPTQLHFRTSQGDFSLHPFVYPPESRTAASQTEERKGQCRLRLLQKGDPYKLAGFVPTRVHFIGVDPPCRLYFLGTDGLGRDLFARILVGGRASLFAGVFSAGLAISIGLLLGGIAGYVGGRIDAFLMTVAELFLALPWLYLLLALRAFLPLASAPQTSFFLIVLVIGLIGWAPPARLFRGAVLAAREQPFIAAAVGYGASHRQLITRHLVPHLTPLLRTQAAILIPFFILGEVALSFLGLGIPQPLPSWGNLLAELQSFHALAHQPLLYLPAVALIIISLCYFLLAPHRSQRTSAPSKS